MKYPLRPAVLWLGLLVVLVVLAQNIWTKEQVLANGQTVLLQLRPVDPRSLMQGDYMVLRYAISDRIAQDAEAPVGDGFAVISINEFGDAQYARIVTDNSTVRDSLADGERLIRFRKRGEHVRVGPNAFFFQEGHAQHYNRARYGELKIDNNGDVVLVGLRSAKREVLRAPKSLESGSG